MSRSPAQRRLRAVAFVSAGLMITSIGVLTAPPALEHAEANPPTDKAAQASERVETYHAERPVAPGVTLTSFDQYGPDVLTGEAGWLQGSLLTADLTGDVSLDRFFPGKVAQREQLSTQANRAGAIAGVNASYFDISTTGAPWRVSIQDGEMLQSPHIDDPNGACKECSVVVTEDGMAQVGEILFEGTVRLPDDATVKLDAINKPKFQITDGIMAFTPVWGEATRNRPVDDTEEKIEVVITNGKVASSTQTPGQGPIPDGSFTLVARGSAVPTLAALEPGDPVSIEYDFRSTDDQKIQAAASGRQILVADGKPQQPRVNSSDPDPHPRTAVGFSKDGGQVFMLTVDGRQPEFSEGVALDELAEMMVELGAHSAVNFDGGGSTTLVARKPGAETAELVNRPSEFDDDEIRPGEFSQRPVPDGLGLFIPEGSGELDGFWLETAADPIRAEGPAYAPRLRTDRVFPELTRAVTSTPHDEMYSPAALAEGAGPTWTTADATVGTVDDQGVFTAGSAGTTKVSASVGEITGELELSVLGDLARIKTSLPRVDLAGGDDPAILDVIGYDADGYSAPIEPADVQLSYDESALKITVEDGRFQVAAGPFEGTQTVEVTVNGVTTQLPVTSTENVETEEVVVEDFETTDNWDLWTMRSTGEWTTTPAGVEGAAGQLDYDNTQSNEARGIGIWPADGFFPLQGRPSELKLQVNSDPVGMRARVEIMDAKGVLQTVEPGIIEESGWQEISYQVPDNVTYPIKLRRIYFNEIDTEASYQGKTLIDELRVVRPVYEEPAQTRPVVDPVVGVEEPGHKGRWNFAVVSQAGITSEDPDGPGSQAARKALDDALDRDSDLVIINGGFVSEGTPRNFALAKKIIEGELGALDYLYVPGPQERSADGSLTDFEKAFGKTQQVVDHRGVRFLVQDTSGTTYKDSDWTQLPKLEKALDTAADTKRVDSVVVVQSQPLRDEVPPATDQLSDPKEAATVEQWLTEFREDTGKGALVVGGAESTFGALRVDGVPQLTNGAADPAKASGAPYGGFAGLSLVHVGPKVGPDGFRAEFLPQVEELAIDGPKSMSVGATEQVTATIRQGADTHQVRYPMGAQWRGLSGVTIVTEDGQRGPERAEFNPDTGELTALSPGKVALRLNVGGESAVLRITIR